ncbi:hypothetical protein CLOP_g9403 [Closterium sp. NIES-67]|nr:hypothetical protein CLOP_g9403 [Closterium sp. NIES-67]
MCKNTRRGRDDDSSVMLERVAFNQGMDELVNSGFGLEGIVTDKGNTYSGAANERGNQAHMGGGDMDVEGEENNRQGSGADENVDPAAGTQQQSGRRWGRRAPRRRTRRGGARSADGNTPTPEEVSEELCLCADHWVGDHSRCGARAGATPKCVSENWGPECAIYERNSATHLAVRDWCRRNFSIAKVACIVEGATSSMNDSFHSLILKYAPKGNRFQGSYDARVALAVIHWNNCMDRIVRAFVTRVRHITRVRRRRRDRVLGPMDWCWVDNILHEWRRPSEEQTDDDLASAAMTGSPATRAQTGTATPQTAVSPPDIALSPPFTRVLFCLGLLPSATPLWWGYPIAASF